MSEPGKHWPTIRRHEDGGYVWTACPECGPNVRVDEDGCCVSCGVDALFFGRETAEAEPEVHESHDMHTTYGLEEGDTGCGNCGADIDDDAAVEPCPTAEPAALADRLESALEEFRYQSSRPGVGMRDLPPHVRGALLPFVLTLMQCDRLREDGPGEPVAWAAIQEGTIREVSHDEAEFKDFWEHEAVRDKTTVIPLYRTPPKPDGERIEDDLEFFVSDFLLPAHAAIVNSHPEKMTEDDIWGRAVCNARGEWHQVHGT